MLVEYFGSMDIKVGFSDEGQFGDWTEDDEGLNALVNKIMVNFSSK